MYVCFSEENNTTSQGESHQNLIMVSKAFNKDNGGKMVGHNMIYLILERKNGAHIYAIKQRKEHIKK